ncbi:MAG: LAGLIDADG family homing endonuclease [archaeon]
MEKEIAEFLGWYFGDGCMSISNGRYQFSITGDLKEELLFYNQTIIPTINKLFYDKLKDEVKLKKYPSVGVCGAYIFNKKFVTYLQEKYNIKHGEKLKVNLPIFDNKEQKIHFLRGLFDTDGSIYFCKSNVKTKKPTFCNTFHYKPKIKLATISKELIDEAHKMLLELGFQPRRYTLRKQRKNENVMYPIVLDTVKDTNKWINEVGFQNPKHITKIEIWREHGFCPPNTKIKERLSIINGDLDPLDYYSSK